MAIAYQGKNETNEANKGAKKKHSWADNVRVSSSANRFSLYKVNHELTGNVPKVIVPCELTVSSPKWERCLVGYFPGPAMPFYAVRDIANKEWKRFGIENVIASDGFFIFRFLDQEGLNGVLQLGPWLFGGKAFILQKWDPLFSFNKNKINRVPVWVRLHALPLSLWTQEGLSFVSSILGTPIACDKATHEGTRFAPARVCVELEASRKPLKFFDLHTCLSSDPIRVKVEYEWKPKWCPGCLLFGHICKSTVRDSEQPKSQGNRVVPSSMQANPSSANPPLPVALTPPKLSNSNSNDPTPDMHSQTETCTSKLRDLKNPASDILGKSASSSNQLSRNKRKPDNSAVSFDYKRALSIYAAPSGPKAITAAESTGNKSMEGAVTPRQQPTPSNFSDFEGSMGPDDSDAELDFFDYWGEGDITLPLQIAKPRTEAICGLNSEASLGRINNFEPSRESENDQNLSETPQTTAHSFGAPSCPQLKGKAKKKIKKKGRK